VAELEPGGPAARDLHRLWTHVEGGLGALGALGGETPMRTALTA
jgi:chromosome partitioning protein